MSIIALGSSCWLAAGRAFRGCAIAPVLLLHSAMEHGSFLAVFPAPLRKTTKPLQSLARSPQYGSQACRRTTSAVKHHPWLLPRENSRKYDSTLARITKLNNSKLVTPPIPIPVKEFRTLPKPLSCAWQCFRRYHSATPTIRASLWPPLR